MQQLSDKPVRVKLKKRDVVRMLMAMDRYQVESVTVSQDDAAGAVSWQLPGRGPKTKKAL